MIWMIVTKIPSPKSPRSTIFFLLWILDLRRTGKGKVILHLVSRTVPKQASIFPGGTHVATSKIIVSEENDK